MAKPRIDLGRQGDFITWNEWIGRSGEAAHKALPEQERDRLRLVVTLKDGRRMRVHSTEVHAHDPGAESPVAVITGYVFVGHYAGDFEGESVISLAVPPGMIASVEWVELPEEEDKRFGFAAAHQKPGDKLPEIQDHKDIHGAVSLVTSTEPHPMIGTEPVESDEENPADA
ncbi:MAG: hypothetical protein ACF8QF_11830 [Phycisphaerales bacterium]